MCHRQPTRHHFETFGALWGLSELWGSISATRTGSIGVPLPLLKIWWLHPNPCWSPFYRSCGGSWIIFIHICLLCLFKIYPDFTGPPVWSHIPRDRLSLPPWFGGKQRIFPDPIPVFGMTLTGTRYQITPSAGWGCTPSCFTIVIYY